MHHKNKRTNLLTSFALIFAILYPTNANSLDGKLASEALSTIGINTHLGFLWTAYGKLTDQGRNPSKISGMLRYTGISLIRDSIPGEPWQAPTDRLFDQYGLLADAGIHFDLQLVSTQDLGSKVDRLAQFQEKHPGSIVAIEGLNEVQDRKTNPSSPSPDEVVAGQNELFNAVRRHEQLDSAKVYNFSTHDKITSPSILFEGKSIKADLLNLHSYSSPESKSPAATMTDKLLASRGLLPSAQVVITETGHPTEPNLKSWGSVSEDVQAKSILSTIFDGLAKGFSAIYIYELIDNNFDKPNSYDPENHYGIFRSDGTPKIAANALHNLHTIMSQKDDAIPALGPLPKFNISRSGVNAIALNKPGGFFILVWSEPRLWNHVTMESLVTPATSLSINIKANFKELLLYDPMRSSEPLYRQAGNSKISLSTPDHPIILEGSY